MQQQRQQPRPRERREKIVQVPINFGAIIGSVLVFAAALGVAAGLFLFKTESGRRQLARWGYNVSADAYVSLGRDYLDNGYITQAVETLEVAREKNSTDITIALELGSVYEIDGQREKAMAIYTEVMETLLPEHTEAYTRMIRIYQDMGESGLAVELMNTALEKTGSQIFTNMIREYVPKEPDVSVNGANFTEPQTLTFDVPDGVTIYYTVNGDDPQLDGRIYTPGEELYVEEGSITIRAPLDEASAEATAEATAAPAKTATATTEMAVKEVIKKEARFTLRAVAINASGVPSTEITEVYRVIIPTPDSPKANYASKGYTKPFRVSLRGDKNTVAIYYTLDNTPATINSMLYTEPILIPVGDTILRAVLLSSNGKTSYEMTVSYSVQGKMKAMFKSSDTFKNLTLMKTTYDAFVKKYGEPLQYGSIDGDGTGASYEGKWSWGVARFVEKTEGKKPILYYLDTNDSAMVGPRKTKVGTSTLDVISAFRDKGSVANEDGERLLYNYSDSSVKVNTMIGTYRKEADGTYAAHYYYPNKDGSFVELSYYFADDAVSRIVWTRYLAAKQ